MQRRTLFKTTLAAATLTALQATVAFAENTVLKIGFVGVTSGPAAAWGISNQRSMEARAAWINETGGYTIGGTTYDIEIVSFDDQKDPKRAIAGMEKMAQQGIHYVVVRTLTMAQRLCGQWQNQVGLCISRMLFQNHFIKRLRLMPS